MKTCKIKNREEFRKEFDFPNLAFLEMDLDSTPQPEHDRVLYERSLNYLFPHKPSEVIWNNDGYTIKVDDTNFAYMIKKIQGKIAYRVWYKDTMHYDIHRINFNTGEIWLGKSTPFKFGFVNNPDIVLMKSTNFIDRKGSTLWEGDIIISNPDKTHDRKCLVTLDPYHGVRLYVYSAGDHIGPCVWEYDKDAVVIGNIFENPELLKN